MNVSSNKIDSRAFMGKNGFIKCTSSVPISLFLFIFSSNFGGHIATNVDISFILMDFVVAQLAIYPTLAFSFILVCRAPHQHRAF